MSRKWIIALAGCTMVASLAMGCSKGADTSNAAPPPANGSGEAAGPRKMEKGGAAADSGAYPAPSGVKTGSFEGGRK